jgi:hypothetical protein
MGDPNLVVWSLDPIDGAERAVVHQCGEVGKGLISLDFLSRRRSSRGDPATPG